MNSGFTSKALQTVTAFLLFSNLIACTQYGDTRPKDTAVSGQTFEGKQSVKPKMALSVLDANRASQIVADDTDNPAFYAVNGTLVPRTVARKLVLNGAIVACMARVANAKFGKDEFLRVTHINAGPVDGGPALHFLNIASLNEYSQAGVALLCVKRGAAVTLDEARNALRGTISILN
jgi:hypothetical protein